MENAQAHKPKPRLPKWLLLGICGVLSLVSVAVAGGILWLSSELGGRYVENIIRNDVSEAAGFDIEVKGLHYSFPASVRVRSLVFSDPEGEWLTAENLFVSAIPSMGILDNMVLPELSAQKLAVLRAPVLAASEQQEAVVASGPTIRINKLVLQQLTLASALTDLPENLVGKLEGDLSWDGADSKLETELEGRFSGLAEQLGEVAVQLDLDYDVAQGDFALGKLHVQNDKLEVNGTANLNLERGTVLAAVETSQLQLADFAPAASGHMQFSAEVGGTFDLPEVNAEIQTKDINHQGQSFPDATTRLSATKIGEQLNGKLVIDAEKDMAAALDYALQGDVLELNNLQVRYLNAVLSGSANLNTQTQLADGRFTLKVPDITAFKGYLTGVRSGSLQTTLALSIKEKTQMLDASIQMRELRMDDVYARQVALNAAGSLQTFKASLKAEGMYEKSWQLNTAADIALQDGANWRVDITRFAAKHGEMALRNAGKAYVQGRPDGGLEAKIEQLAMGRGRYTLDVRMDQHTIDANLDAKDIYLIDFDRPLPPELKQAQADVKAGIKGAVGSPKAQANVVVSGIRAHEDALQSKLKADMQLGDGKLMLDADISDGTHINSQITAQLPAMFAVQPFAFTVPEDGALSGRAKLDLKSGAFAALLPPEHEFKGRLSGDLKFSGSVKSPAINGELRISEAQYDNVPLGIELPSIEGRIIAAGQRFTLKDFMAKDSKGVALNASGGANFADDAFSYKLQAKGNNVQLLNHPQATGVFTLDVNLEGDEKSGRVGGNITSERIEIYLPDHFTQSVPELNIVKTLPDDIGKTGAAEVVYPLALDMTFKADNKVFVRGRGVDAELKGKLAITGQAAEPDVSGKLSTIRGRYEEFGKLFTLKKVELLFDGDMPPSPYLTLVAANKVGSVEVRPVLSGPVADPSLKIESSPSMPDDEALSLLLFGESPSDITPLQAVQLADSLRRLSGKGGGGSFNPVGEVRDLLGVDDLKINNDGGTTEDMSVGVGKYLADGVYLEVEQGADSNSSKASIEIELTPSISVESSTGATGTNNVGVNWKHDY